MSSSADGLFNVHVSLSRFFSLFVRSILQSEVCGIQASIFVFIILFLMCVPCYLYGGKYITVKRCHYDQLSVITDGLLSS
jgi:hypothetical protein